MKQTIVLIALIFAAATGSGLYAQVTPPPGAGDKDLRDSDVKRRSVDLERVDRDAKKDGKNKTDENTEDRLAAKFAEIKSDYEQIQLSQDAVLKAYQTGNKIDYAQISKSAQEINKSAARLNSNLFPAEKDAKKKEEKKKDKSAAKDAQPAKNVRDLIVDLDNTIGSFTKSPLFQNLRAADPEVSKQARQDLEKIIELSALLADEAGKTEASGGK